MDIEYIRKIASVVMASSRSTDFDLDDLVQQGCLGFMRAERTFDDSEGVLFSTHAYRCVRGEMMALLQSATKSRSKHSQPPRADMCMECVADPKSLGAETLEQMCEGLTAYESLIVHMRYQSNMTFQEIADELQLSKSDAQRIHDAIIQKLRSSFGEPL